MKRLHYHNTRKCFNSRHKTSLQECSTRDIYHECDGKEIRKEKKWLNVINTWVNNGSENNYFLQARNLLSTHNKVKYSKNIEFNTLTVCTIIFGLNWDSLYQFNPHCVGIPQLISMSWIWFFMWKALTNFFMYSIWNEHLFSWQFCKCGWYFAIILLRISL